ncbi:uncharacterized protein [Penaeus vannamei]|uniref:uncharacterized protein n=1 Tax=Penaeus vannamei TaxID=6689 RepID=UPI00387F51B0
MTLRRCGAVCGAFPVPDVWQALAGNCWGRPPTAQIEAPPSFFRADILAKPIHLQAHCGPEIEYQGVTVSLLEGDFQVFDIYRPPPPRESARLQLDNIFAKVNDSPSILCGNFNAHDPLWNNPSTSSAHKTCTSGHHLIRLLRDFPQVSLISKRTSTHMRGGVLDLLFVSTPLSSLMTWSLHSYLASDHFAVTVTIDTPRIPSPPPTLKWKANWHLYTQSMETWACSFDPPNNIDQLESEIVQAIHIAANQTIPLTTPTTHHRNHWFYDERVKELRRRLLILRKTLHKHPSPELLQTYREAIPLIREKIQEIKTNKWLEWCESLNVHTSLHDLWRRLNIVAGKFKSQAHHPQPKTEADALLTTFALQETAESDEPFTQQEVKQALKINTNTAPGLDNISYSMLNHLGPEALSQLHLLFNKSLAAGRLPTRLSTKDNLATIYSITDGIDSNITFWTSRKPLSWPTAKSSSISSPPEVSPANF